MDIQVFVAWPGSQLLFVLLSVFVSYCHKNWWLALEQNHENSMATKKKKKSFWSHVGWGPLISVRLAWDDAALFHVPLIFLVAGLGRSANTPLVRTSPALPTVERKRWYWKGMAKGESQTIAAGFIHKYQHPNFPWDLSPSSSVPVGPEKLISSLVLALPFRDSEPQVLSIKRD